VCKKMEEVVIARPKEGNANFEELFIGGAHEEEEEEDDYGFARDARNAAAIGLDIPGFDQPPYLNDAPENPFPSGGGGGAAVPGGPTLSSEVLTHLKRRAEFLTNPVVMFVAEVATSAGSSLAQMMINPSLPLVDTQAPTIQSLLSGSQMPRDLLLVVLAKILLDHPQVPLVTQPANTVELVPLKKTEEPQTPASKGLGSDSSGTPLGSAGGTNSMIGETIRDYIETLDQISIGPFGRAAAAPPAPGPQQQQGPDPQRLLYDQLVEIQKTSQVLEWAWSEMPEQSGMMLLKPEISTIIQSCFESVRALSPSHRNIQLWHLLTGPLVRHKFARLVGSLLNTVPGDVQYPGYNNARRNGAVTGSRVSSGIVLQTRHSRVYSALLSWFKNVSYRESEEWLQVNQRLQEADQKIANARSELAVARANLIQAAETVFNKYLNSDTRQWAGDLWSLEFQPDNEQMYIATANLRKEIRLKLASARPVNGIDAIAGSDAFYLVPLIEKFQAPQQGRAYVANGSFKRKDIALPPNGDTANLLKILKEGKAATENISRRLVYATGGPGDGTRALLNLNASIEIMMSALLSIRRVIDQVLSDKRLYASFDEVRKKELVHREPSIREGDDTGGRQPLRNFLY
jgi:hypothetical protein